MPFFKLNTSVRILLLTSQALHVFAGDKDHFVAEERFAAEEQGLAAFDCYLAASPDSPVYFVVDLSEEDFRVESIAHVGRNDRKVLLERKLLQFFRGSEYRSARLQEREEGGRRDDRVLFSALTNPDLLAPWIAGLLRQKIRIKGIVSVPLLMELFADFLQFGRLPHLLLVNLEEQVGMRQTYLQKSRLKFSRIMAMVGSDSLAEILLAECRHTRQYLERLKLLPHDQPLQVHVCVADGMAGVLNRELAASPLLQFHLHETGMIGAELGIDPLTSEGQSPVFLCLLQALRTNKLFNAYAPPPVTRYHRLRQIRQGLIVGTSLLAALILPAGGMLVHEGLAMITARGLLEQETLRFRGRLEELRQTFPQTPIPAAAMRAIVEAADRIRAQEIMPVRAMVMVSRAMALCPDIHLKRFEWQLSVLTGIGEVAVSSAAPPMAAGIGGQAPVPAVLPGLLEGKTGGVATVNGMVFPSGGYGNAQQSVNQFIAALERIPGMKVTPLSMPTDTKPNATVKAKLDDSVILAEFSLKLEYQVVR